jgi:hypothetical protein
MRQHQSCTSAAAHDYISTKVENITHSDMLQVFLGCAGALAAMTVLSTALGAVTPTLVRRALPCHRMETRHLEIYCHFKRCLVDG